MDLKYNVDALRNPIFRGRTYKRIKSFRSERKADAYAKKLEGKCPSKRYPPLIEKQNIGWKFGCRYNVCMPKAR